MRHAEIDDRDVVNSLARGLDVIRAFTRQKPTMTLTDVSKASGLSRATARRFLLTLVREGYARRDRWQVFQPSAQGPGARVLGLVVHVAGRDRPAGAQ